MLACADGGDRHWHRRKKVGRWKSVRKGALGRNKAVSLDSGACNYKTPAL